MTEHPNPGRLTRRAVLTGGAGVAAAVALRSKASSSQPAAVPLDDAKLAASVPVDIHLAATDGWVSIADAAQMTADETAALAPFWPDPLAFTHGDAATQAAAPAGSGLNLYAFGFRNVTGLTDAQVINERGKAQISAPLLAFDQDTPYRVKLSNLGLSQRPDLVDGHTIHWHGFVNEVPMFDGVPELSLSVPIGRSFTYYYVPRDPGTYMYHCHFEDVEHVQMGMTGLLFVRPAQNKGAFGVSTPASYTNGNGAKYIGYAYNDYVPPTDALRSTAYNREFGIFETEIFAEGHYRDAHIQTTDWTDFRASFWALNGRTFPDTVAPAAPPTVRGYDPLASSGRLQYQPQNALITANAGDRVLLRVANLGYQNHAMTADNIAFTIVGRDASMLRTPLPGKLASSTTASDFSYNFITTNQIEVGPGESADCLFTAPKFSTADVTATGGNTGKGYDSYLFYDRNYAYASNGGAASKPGGMVTEIRVFPGTLPAQTQPNA